MRRGLKWLVLVVMVVGMVAVSCAPAAPAPTPAPKPAPTPGATAPTPAPTPAPAPAAPAKKMLLNFASGSSSGVTYMHAVVVADILNKNIPEIIVTALEGGGAIENIGRIKRGEAHMSNVITQDVAYQVWDGEGVFAKDGKWRDFRLMAALGEKPYLIYVRSDTGITQVEQLTGKKFSAGDAGGATENATMKVFAEIGVKPDWAPMSSKEAVQSLQDRRIVGHVQAQEGKNNMAAATIQLMASQGINPISLTESQQEKAQKKYPFIPWMVVPAGGFQQAPKWPEIRAFGSNGGWMVLRDMPQAIQYKIYKTYVANIKDVGKSYKLALVYRPIEDDIVYLKALANPIPLAAGVVQWAIEQGINVPDWAIPPEYVPVRK